MGRLVDDVVDVVPVVVLVAGHYIRSSRVIVDQRPMTVGVRSLQAVQLGQCHGLNHRETLRRSVFEVPIRFLAVESMKHLPRRIAQIEKWSSVVVS
jgi:hypothetical protein